MKKNIILLFIIPLLASCGPHRMKCGPKGICKSSEKREKTTIITIIKT